MCMTEKLKKIVRMENFLSRLTIRVNHYSRHSYRIVNSVLTRTHFQARIDSTWKCGASSRTFSTVCRLQHSSRVKYSAVTAASLPIFGLWNNCGTFSGRRTCRRPAFSVIFSGRIRIWKRSAGRPTTAVCRWCSVQTRWHNSSNGWTWTLWCGATKWWRTATNFSVNGVSSPSSRRQTIAVSERR